MTYESTLRSIAATDERVIVMTAENRAAIRALPDVLGERFIDVGICEQTMLGAAAGLALRGRIPVVHALAAFLTMRAFEFTRTDVGIAHLPVKLIGAVPGFLSDGNGPTHQAIEDIAIMRGIPGMHIFCPADAEELNAFLPVIIHSQAPWYVRFNALAPVVSHTEAPVPGKAEILSEGYDVALLTYGFMLREAHRARELLEGQGVSVRLVNLRTLVPLDTEAVLSAVLECSLTVTLEDHFQTGGLYSILAELLLGRGMGADVLPIALTHWFSPGRLEHVLDTEGFSAVHIAHRILRQLEGNSTPMQTESEYLFKTYL
ncbi:MAG: transketolase [Bacteroidia bacterium]|nr:transketolase [Bacteroidia bacterium]